jgi:hypothetical protein
MAVKFVSRNNIGIVCTLLFVIVLSQSRFFDFLMNTYLGRFFLILSILGISWCHKIFGIVAVLFIIIMFNQSEMSFFEGFTDPSGNEMNASTISANIQQKKDELKNKLATNAESTSTSDATTATTSAATTSATTSNEILNGKEGFNMIEREDVMKRGKNSKSMPVFLNNRKQGDNIEPTDSSVFSGLYSSV